jgi:7-carboxy-7-deazaguanine synthase
LRATDQVKFVICGRPDYEWSRSFVAEHGIADRCQVLFSPSHGQMSPKDLAEWILADKLPVRLQVQLHKYLWGSIPGH